MKGYGRFTLLAGAAILALGVSQIRNAHGFAGHGGVGIAEVAIVHGPEWRTAAGRSESA